MYTSFFGLNEKPFSITPDPRYLFMSARHTEALAHLMYGVRESGGFIQLTGEVGTGKTTLIRSLLQQLPDTADVALILNPQLSKNEFLSAICEELGVPLPGAVNSIKALVDALNTYLLDNHSRARRTILIVDEAQNLRLDVLEQVRLLTNLETPKQKLLQIILIGQPELRDILDRNDMRQLAQRVTGRYHLQPLSQDETRVYIEHRLKVAGAVGPIFSNASKKELYQLSRGVPRRINVMADRALLGAFTQEIRQVTPKLLRKAAAEVLDKKAWTFSPWRRWLRAGGIGIVLAAMAIGAGWAWSEWPRLFPEPETNRAAEASEAAFSIDEASHSEAAEGPGAAAENLFAVDSVQDEQSTDELSTDQATAGTGPGVHSNVGQFLHENSGDTSLQSAFGTLFNFWGITYSPETLNACRQAERSGLLCLTKSGSLAQVKNLNRPVLLTLRDYGGEPHKVVLSGLSDATAIISIADKDYRISVTEFIDLWFGDYLLLWRPESSPVQQFSPGMRSDEVIWLRQSLAEIQGVPIAPMDSNLFDSNLEARVRSYQRENRLEVDGVVGYQTQIIINTDLGSVNRPSLVRAN